MACHTHAYLYTTPPRPEIAPTLPCLVLVLVQADDEVSRHYAQEVFNDEMGRFIKAAAEPLFAVMSTGAVHKPLDSRHRHRLATFESRGYQLSDAGEHCYVSQPTPVQPRMQSRQPVQ